MKIKSFLMISCAALCFHGEANATYIVDTGTPSSGPSWSFNASQYFGGEFSIGSNYLINSVEGYFSNAFTQATGNVTISIHSDAGNIPGGTLFTASKTLAGGSALNWYGVNNLNWSLGAGTYWVTFAPDGNISGTMPGYAPAPLDEYAQHSGGIWQDRGQNFFDYLDVGIRIDATSANNVPEPSTIALFGLGLLGISALRKRI